MTPYVGGNAQTPVQVGASATSTTVSGLTNGTSYTFKVTATNAVGTSPASAASNVATPQTTIFDFASPAVADSGDTSAVELGVKFRSSFPGTVTGIRFYKGPGNTGTHVGSLWSASGTKLADATFTSETGSGWQTALFATPVTIAADTTYVASYSAPNGHYSVSASGFSSAVTNGPLTGLANGDEPERRLRVRIVHERFPQGSFNASNYFVDVLFAAAGAPGTPSGVTATAGQSSANVSWTAPTSGGPVASYTITPFIGVDGADREDDHRHPAGHQHDRRRAHRRPGVHLHGQGGEPVGHRTRVRALVAGHADVRLVARRPDGRHGAGRRAGGDRPLDRALGRGRQPDHRLHRDPVRRRHGADARAGRRRRDRPPRHGPHRRHGVHVHGEGRERGGLERRLRRHERGDARAVAVQQRHAGHRRLRRHRAP